MSNFPIDILTFSNATKGPEINLLCQTPMIWKNERPKGTVNERNPWPVCSRPPCTCTNTKNVKVVEHIQVLRFACNETYDTFHDTKGIAYIAPKRINCGSYEPKKPTFASRCTCQDMEERK